MDVQNPLFHRKVVGVFIGQLRRQHGEVEPARFLRGRDAPDGDALSVEVEEGDGSLALQQVGLLFLFPGIRIAILRALDIAQHHPTLVTADERRGDKCTEHGPEQQRQIDDIARQFCFLGGQFLVHFPGDVILDDPPQQATIGIPVRSSRQGDLPRCRQTRKRKLDGGVPLLYLVLR